MVAPVAAYVQLPVDTTNTGKKKRTQTKIVGAHTVHEDFVVLTSERDILGHYISDMSLMVLPIVAQDVVTTGLCYFYNPVAGTKKLAIKKIKMSVQFAALAVDMNPGLLAIDKFTVTGTGSGTANTLVPTNSAAPASTANSRQAVTGLAITPLGFIASYLLPVMGLATGGAGSFPSQNIDWNADSEEDDIILLPGEGICIYSAATLITANRRLTGSIHYSEFS